MGFKWISKPQENGRTTAGAPDCFQGFANRVRLWRSQYSWIGNSDMKWGLGYWVLHWVLFVW